MGRSPFRLDELLSETRASSCLRLLADYKGISTSPTSYVGAVGGTRILTLAW